MFYLKRIAVLYPNRTLNLYNDILEMLSYLSKDDLEILKHTSNFLDTYNKILGTHNIGNKKT